MRRPRPSLDTLRPEKEPASAAAPGAAHPGYLTFTLRHSRFDFDALTLNLTTAPAAHADFMHATVLY
jgi:hypothetical protein